MVETHEPAPEHRQPKLTLRAVGGGSVLRDPVDVIKVQ